MVDRNLIREFNVDEDELNAVFGAIDEMHQSEEAMDKAIDERAQAFDINELIKGTIIRIDSDEVLVDIGYKSEGIVQALSLIHIPSPRDATLSRMPSSA